MTHYVVGFTYRVPASANMDKDDVRELLTKAMRELCLTSEYKAFGLFVKESNRAGKTVAA